MKKYYLKKYHQVISFGEDLMISNKKGELRVKNEKGNIDTLQMLAQEGIEAEVLKLFPIYKKLMSIGALEFIEHPNTNRNELFFQYLGLNPLRKSVKSQKILVFGGGGGGGTLVYMLAQFGFRNITVIDFDIVEISDLEKTLIYDHGDIGKLKIEALKAKICKNFGIEIETLNKRIKNEAELEEVIFSISPKLVVNAIDPGPFHKLNLNRVCFKNSVPFVLMAYSFDQLLIGPFLIPGLTDCYNSYDNEIKKSKDNELGLSAFKKVDINGLFHPSISFNINSLASIILKDIILFFYKKYDDISCLNKLITMSLISMNGVSLEMQCDEDCLCKIKP